MEADEITSVDEIQLHPVHGLFPGLGTGRHCVNAVKLFKQVSERGNSGVMYKAHKAQAANAPEQALWYYAAAAEMGFELGQSNAATLYETVDLLDERTLLYPTLPCKGGASSGAAVLTAGAAAGSGVAGVDGAAGAVGGGDASASASSSSSVQRDVVEGEELGAGGEEEAELNDHSLRLWIQSAAQGNYKAHLLIGDAYYYGRKGQTPKHVQAAAHYRAASGHRSARASWNLGYMYVRGKIERERERERPVWPSSRCVCVCVCVCVCKNPSPPAF